MKIFGTILKEYKDAENGVTQGIRMTERKTKLMREHKTLVKKFVYATLFGTLLFLLVFRSFLEDMAD